MERPSNFVPPVHLPQDTERDHTLESFHGLWMCSCKVQVYFGATSKHDAASRHGMHTETVRGYRSRDMETGSGDYTVEEPNSFSPFRRGVLG